MACYFIPILSAFLVLGCSFGTGGKIPPRIDHSRTTSFENGVLTIAADQLDGTSVFLSTRDNAQSEFEFQTEMPAAPVAGAAYGVVEKVLLSRNLPMPSCRRKPE